MLKIKFCMITKMILNDEEKLKIIRKDEDILLFCKLSWEEIKELSLDGVLGPYKSKGQDKKGLLSGVKPVWLCPTSDTKEFLKENPEFKRRFLPNLEIRNSFLTKSGKKFEFNDCAVFKESNKKYYEKLCKSYLIWIKEEGKNIASHILCGLALGYTKNDIAKYISHNYNQQKFESWKTMIQEGGA